MAEHVFRLDTTEYRKQFALVFKNSKQTADRFAYQQSGLFTRQIVDLTPPGSYQVSGTASKRRGEAAVKRDIERLFIPARKTKARLSDSALPIIHERSRNARGRVSGKRRTRHPARPAALAAYIRLKQSHVGSLAAGWNEAASRFGRRSPAWIWRHNTRGYVTVAISDRGVRIRITNAMPWASEVADLERRVVWALAQRTHAMRRLNEDYARRLRAGTIFR